MVETRGVVSTSTSWSSAIPGTAVQSTSDASSSPIRNAIVAPRQRGERQVERPDRPTFRERIGRRRSHQPGTEAYQLVQNGPGCRPAGVSSYTVDEKGGGGFLFSTMPAASSSFSRSARTFVPIPGKWSARSV